MFIIERIQRFVGRFFKGKRQTKLTEFGAKP